MFSPANTSKAFSTYADKGLYFRNAPSDILQGSTLADVIVQDGHTTVGILALDDDYGTGLAEDLTAALTEGGAEVVETVIDRKSTRLNSSHYSATRMPSSA